MRILFLCGVMALAGCTSFFQSRVTDHDRAIRSIQQSRSELLARASGLGEDIAIARRSGGSTDSLQRELGEVQSSISRAESELDRERQSQAEALKGASTEMKYKQEMLAALLGIGATAISTLVRIAKRAA